jgi:hypothetical protein
MMFGDELASWPVASAEGRRKNALDSDFFNPNLTVWYVFAHSV